MNPEPTRYDVQASAGYGGEHMCAYMEASKTGEWVNAADYDALRVYAIALEAENAALREQLKEAG